MSKRYEVIGICTAVNMVVVNHFGNMAPLLYMVIILMLLDLVTRVYAASMRRDEHPESKKVLIGLYKKLGMCFLIVLSLILDFGLKQITTLLGISIATKIIFTNLTLAWLFVRELISNLENLQLAGIELPKFIMKALDLVEKKVDTTGEFILSNGEQEKTDQGKIEKKIVEGKINGKQKK